MNVPRILLVVFIGASLTALAGDARSGQCAADAECADGMFCDYKVGQCAVIGDCAPVPDSCEPVFEPVCGCDGTSYMNACMAAASGVSIDFAGSCTGEFNCKLDSDCVDGWYCSYVQGVCGAPGTCQWRPEGCTADYDPVCGCDGQTYSNACVAAGNGASIAHAGWCDDYDVDADSVPDTVDNCLGRANPDQFDTDGDRIGNACDPDVSPPVNDCVVNFQDLNVLRLNFLVPGYLDTDFNNDAQTNMQDLAVMKQFFYQAPGPSALDNACD